MAIAFALVYRGVCKCAASGSSRLQGAQTTAQNLWPIDPRIILAGQKAQWVMLPTY
ncbi:hypothetical protein [Escherichia coli]|uniref:hypothetical protein n=1 Tax=Escherichia coli TaxID=562 RepID=UPI0015F87BFA|nr:hypothetical protein [Escherichia coli]